MTTTTYSSGGVTPRTNVFAARTMLEHAQPVIVLGKFGQTKELPPNKTDTIKFRRPVVFSAATTPLQEGVTPTSTSFRYEDVTAVLKQYGQVVEVTDKISDLHEDPVIQGAAEQSGENIGRTMEAITYGVVKAGTNVFYANGSARNSVNTPISIAKQRAVVRALEKQKAMRITKILDGSIKYATKPVEASWVATGHTDLENDVRDLPGFTPVAEYGSRSPLHEYELGSVENVRYILSPDLGPIADAGGTYNGSGDDMVSTSGTSADVYPVLFFGKEAYGTVPLRGKGAVSPSIIRPGTISAADPLGQRGYIGWKSWFTAVILNQLWMARLEVAATAL